MTARKPIGPCYLLDLFYVKNHPGGEQTVEVEQHSLNNNVSFNRFPCPCSHMVVACK